MASSSRRTISSFSLSFLDIMFCGFGAVVLLVLIINSNTVNSRQERVADFQSEFMQQELINRLAREHLEQIRQHHNELLTELTALRKDSTDLLADIQRIAASTSPQAQKTNTENIISSLQEELKALEKEKQLLAAQKKIARETGRQVRSFEGEGNRQYLTGLKLGGRRVLILIDSSASMLDSKIVDIIRRKVLDDSKRRTAPKWQKTVSTVEWIIANLPAQSAIQLYSFNSKAAAVTAGDRPKWIPVTDNNQIDTVLSNLKKIAPNEGTNLHDIFLKARTISPLPDNIILLTDGLPTQGTGGSRSRTVTGKQRVTFFEQAVKRLPENIPVNIILFPIEGDPMAPVLYWKLAIDSGGSFLTPTRDWP